MEGYIVLLAIFCEECSCLLFVCFLEDKVFWHPIWHLCIYYTVEKLGVTCNEGHLNFRLQV